MRWNVRSAPLRSTCTVMPGYFASKVWTIFVDDGFGGQPHRLDVGGRRPAGCLNLPQQKGVNQALNTLYHSEDVDPIVTGQLYTFRNNSRDVYTGRIATGSEYGLQEFSSSGAPGDVGVDVGPNSLVEYEDSVGRFDDGIPEAWAFPSSPYRWYRPDLKEDYYGMDGPELYNPKGLYPLYVPDNDPRIGEDEDPPLS